MLLVVAAGGMRNAANDDKIIGWFLIEQVSYESVIRSHDLWISTNELHIFSLPI